MTLYRELRVMVSKGEDAIRKKERQNARGKGTPIGTGEASSSNQPPKGYKRSDLL